MVLGNGLIANSLLSYKDNNDIIIFASGVSNSNEIDQYEFNREVKLLEELKIDNRKLVYFSTCSIFDESLKDSPYVNHKINMENIIKDKFDKYLILRLPNIVSNSSNPNTSFNFFKKKINMGEEIICKKDSYRYFIDIDDISNISPIFIDSMKYNNDIVNIAFSNKENIYNFLLKMYSIVKKDPKIKIINGGCNYDIDNDVLLSEIKRLNYDIGSEYNSKLIKKYI